MQTTQQRPEGQNAPAAISKSGHPFEIRFHVAASMCNLTPNGERTANAVATPIVIATFEESVAAAQYGDEFLQFSLLRWREAFDLYRPALSRSCEGRDAEDMFCARGAPVLIADCTIDRPPQVGESV
jgi:hypothetical protein